MTTDKKIASATPHENDSDSMSGVSKQTEQSKAHNPQATIFNNKVNRRKELSVPPAESAQPGGKYSGSARDNAATLREDTANIREDAANAREDAANAREDTANAREDTANIREVTANAREDTANLREHTANARDDTANVRDDVAHLREEKTSSREHKVQLTENQQTAIDDHMLMLQQVNERLVIATIESQTLAEQLQITKDKLEKASLAKSNFLSSMSHELRTPLNAILGFSQLLEGGKPQLTESQNKRLQQIIKAGWYLLELINEILDLSVIESGKQMLQLELVSLPDIINECKNIIQPLADKQGIQLSFPHCDNTLLTVTDPTRLKQILINLLSNAIKYNREHGTVELTCNAIAADTIRISINDSGIGISTEKIQQLFQPFNRLGQESGKVEGTGIGLVVAKQLVELMGGSIGVESTDGVGSKFWINLILNSTSTLPANHIPSTLPQTRSNAQPATPQCRILYVEDNPANLKLVEEIMADRPDICMLSAHDGIFGIELAQSYVPDVILMDVNLPGISGVEAMRILHGNPATRHIPIIALSANAMPKDIENGLAAGFFHYLTKPIKIKEFNTVLDKALNHAASAKMGCSTNGITS